jgi:hypothetical protein
MTIGVKTLFLISFLTSASLICCGQKDTIVDNVKYNYSSRYDNGKIHELGYNLKKGEKIIKHGQWIVYEQDGKLVEKGSYNKNKKTGFWSEKGTDNEGNNCYCSGYYLKGKKDGQWWTGGNICTLYKHGRKKWKKYFNRD